MYYRYLIVFVVGGGRVRVIIGAIGAVTLVALVFTTILGFLTLYVIFENGLDVLSAISVIVVAMFFFSRARHGHRRPPHGDFPVGAVPLTLARRS